MKIENVLERVYDRRRLRLAWKQIRKNAGAAGIDEMTVGVFEEKANDYLHLIHEKLLLGSYRFRPARRVLIPKNGSTSKKRKLGIPVVMDRVVSQSMNLVFMEVFDKSFTPSNFGFRRGKSQHAAIGPIEKTNRMVAEFRESKTPPRKISPKSAENGHFPEQICYENAIFHTLAILARISTKIRKSAPVERKISTTLPP